MSEANDSEAKDAAEALSGEFDFTAANDEERFRHYCELRDERYRKLVKSLEKQVQVLADGIRFVDEELVRVNRGRR